MSKPFDYSKWDKIELSDDEDDVHPNIDKESWFRMKHRSRVEREENEAKDKEKIRKEMDEFQQRLRVIQHELRKRGGAKEDSDEDSDDDEGLEAERAELERKIQQRQEKLDEYAKNQKWNVDNMFQVKEERTVVNETKVNYTPTGFVMPKDEELIPQKDKKADKTESKKKSTASSSTATATKKPAASSTSPSKSTPAGPSPPPPKNKPKEAADVGSMDTYHQFTEKYADVVEEFMALPDLAASHEFLKHNAEIILQENASNYLLLASLEDAMNEQHDKMKRTARQSQIVTNIAELAKTLQTHPGNVLDSFFARLQQREHLEDFVKGCKAFEQKIAERAVVKRKEMDAQRNLEEGQSIEDVPLEERVGPGGLDPLEVIETLPEDMVRAFESRNIDDLKEALMKLSPEDAEYHMKRCVDSGLWVANS